jgi:hypothetical protein
VTKADLLAAWRDAVRAAEMAERLATAAAQAAEQAGVRAEVSSEIADLAERAAESAQRAAERARTAATEAAEMARSLRDEGVPGADKTVRAARDLEDHARVAYNSSDEDDRRSDVWKAVTRDADIEDLQAVSDQVLVTADRIRRLEEEKRRIDPATLRFRELSDEIEKLATQIRLVSRAESDVARQVANVPGLPTIDEADQKAAERRG